MAEALYEKIEGAQHHRPFIGHQILDIITAGMYDDPLMVYREYIQNSVDSIDLAVCDGQLPDNGGKIEIIVSGANRSITIQDNGIGLPDVKAGKVLLDLGCSPKEGSGQRGFRGIGRLGGLAYCDLLRFETRSSQEENVTVVEWNRRRLEDLSAGFRQETSLVTVVRNITRVFSRRPTEKDPGHFFRVHLENVQKFHSDKLMNIKLIREYLSQVAPVPYDNRKFSYGQKLDSYFAGIANYKTHNITVNGETILRPYSDKIHISSELADEIRDIECFKFFRQDGGMLALGWYAKTNFTASLPSQVTMRGIRVRHGNIEIGDEYFMSPYFTERRFATWNIGEIHICDNHVKPNARRDGFEQTSEYERFLEQVSLLGRRLSGLCRRHSSDRSLQQTIQKRLDYIEGLLDGSSLFVDREHYDELIKRVEEELAKLLSLINKKDNSEALLLKCQGVKTKLAQLRKDPSFLDMHLDGRSFRHIEKRELLRKIVKAVLNEYDTSSSANDLILRMLTPFLKSVAKNTLRSQARR